LSFFLFPHIYALGRRVRMRFLSLIDIFELKLRTLGIS
jgi:hypothetical protein